MACIVPNCQQSKLSNDKISMHLLPDPTRDPKRHLLWVKSINSEKIYKYDPAVVFKRFRVCRNHFTKDCFNGECKKLLPSAIPTLNIGVHSKTKSKAFHLYKEKILNMLKKNSVNVEEDTLRITESDDFQETIEQENIEKKGQDEEEFMLMEVENSDNKSQFTIVMPELPPVKVPPKVLNYSRRIHVHPIIQQEHITPGCLNLDKITQFQRNFCKDPKNQLAEHICSKLSIFEASHSEETNFEYAFVHKIDMKFSKNPVQTSHWSDIPFAILRFSFMKKYNLPNFEFSQKHFIYYEKLEDCYKFLRNLCDKSNTGDDDEKILIDPLRKGGNWNIFTNILGKYGIMPKDTFPLENPEATLKNVDEILKSKLRQYADVLFDINPDQSNTDIIIDTRISEICDILNICLGTHPQTFHYISNNMDNKIFDFGLKTPLKMYEEQFKDFIDDKCCLINDPRRSLDYGKLYTSNTSELINGTKTVCCNQPIDILIEVIGKSIVNGEPVLAICAKNGINSYKLRNFNLLCNIKLDTNLDKSSRIEMRDYSDKCAMAISAIYYDESARPEKFRLESLNNEKEGCITIPKEYFNEIILEIVISKRFLTVEVRNLIESNDAEVLDPNDPILSPFNV